MTVVNPKSISGITSITTASGSDDLLTIHTNNGTERLRIDSTGATKIVTGIVTTLTATTGIVTTLTANTVTSLGAVSGTTGTFSGDVTANGGDMTISGTSAILHLVDTNDNPNYRVQNIGGTFQIYDATTDTARLSIASGGAATFSGSLSGTTGDFTGAVTLADGVANGLKIGNGQDLILQHNGTNTFIDNNTGDLTLQTTGSGTDINIESLDDVFIKVHGSENAIRCIGDGAVELYQNNEKKLYTATNGTVISSEGDTTLGVYGGSGGSGYAQLYLNGSGTSSNYVQSDNGLIMWINGANRAKFETDGTFIVQDGNINIQTSGHGIDFSATSDASGMTSELLDDYEEGGWTMTAYQGADSITQSAANQRYTKIGNMVTVVGEVNGLTNTTNAVFTLAGLPYNVATGREGAGAAFSNSVTFPSGYNGITVYTYAGADRLRFYVSASGGAWHGVQGSEIGSGDIIFTASYLTN